MEGFKKVGWAMAYYSVPPPKLALETIDILINSCKV